MTPSYILKPKFHPVFYAGSERVIVFLRRSKEHVICLLESEANSKAPLEKEDVNAHMMGQHTFLGNACRQSRTKI